ncbi:MAG: hypothetical protein P4L36_10890 [Holophaga sp.]|nr:hypothetical protein [Holophaga sp.]
MVDYGSATCGFDVDETQDGKFRLIAIKPKADSAILKRGTITLELNSGFELDDAKTLAKMLNDWITQVHFEPIDC